MTPHVAQNVKRAGGRRYASSKGSDGYSPQIFYSYVVDGQEYRSDTYSFFEPSASGWAAAQRITSGYRQGTTVPCYVNPAEPDDATLSREPSFGWLIGLVPFVLLAGGLRVWPRQTASPTPRAGRRRNHLNDPAIEECVVSSPRIVAGLPTTLAQSE